MDSKLIGTVNDDNSIDWPKTDVLGGAFSIPATRHNLTATTFVVLPTGFNQGERSAEMKGSSRNTSTDWASRAIDEAVVTGLEAPEQWQDTTFTGEDAAGNKKGKK